jgi:hypothetical protein
MTEFIHWSERPLELAELQSRDPSHGISKPAGLWFSVGDGDDGWRVWCEEKEFGLASLVHRHNLVLRDDARLLWLHNASEIDSFHDTYSKPRVPLLFNDIDWAKVGEKYQGIIIAPYCWSLRLDDKVNWYYTWDCASGCVWDVGAIEALTASDRVSSPA